MPSPSTPRRIRIFVSSPSDVAEERRLARELIEGVLRKDPAFHDHLVIECVAWDDPEAPTPMIATKVPQDSVNTAKPPPSQCDIVVVVLWSCCRRRKPANKWRIKTECVDQLFGLTLPSADRCRPAVGLGGRWSSDGMSLSGCPSGPACGGFGLDKDMPSDLRCHHEFDGRVRLVQGQIPCQVFSWRQIYAVSDSRSHGCYRPCRRPPWRAATAAGPGQCAGSRPGSSASTPP